MGRAISSVLLVLAYAVVFGAPAVAPYAPSEQHRDLPMAPPTAVHVFDEHGRAHWPFVYADDGASAHPGQDEVRRYSLRFLTSGRLVAVDPPAHLFLAGTDAFGRDVASRLLYGGRISLAAGVLAAAIALGLGVVLGGIAGYAGGWAEWTLMRVSDLLLAIPWLALLLAIRAALPLQVTPTKAFGLITLVIGVAGWARPARLVRGVVLSGRARDYALAARAAGGSPLYVLLRHVLPQAIPVVVTQASILVPQYALAEMTLSFFGLGVAEPVPSWGAMLADTLRQGLLATEWWMAAPFAVVTLMFILHYLVADAIQAATAPAGA
jgi:peptide/nickel transport system permease protein